VTTRALTLALCAAALCAAAPASFAQVTLKPDGQWRSMFTAGANLTSGNTDSTTFNALGEGARVTDRDKITLHGQANYGKVNGVTATQRYLLGGQYNRDISRYSFKFASADGLRDRPSNIAHRYSAAAGFGRHLLLGDAANTFDISLGLGYTQDGYVVPTSVLGATRTEYGRTELVLTEETAHKLSETTKLRQKFTIFPNLTDRGAYRALFDTGVSVAMTSSLSLTAGFTYRFDSDPGLGLKRGDTAFVTGVSLRFD
jgi:putative salt-induced outer membrane protein